MPSKILGDDTFIVTVGDIKGGVAKTTTVMEVAMGLARRGEPVVVLDADNTGGATLWQRCAADEEQYRKEQAEAAGRHYEPRTLGFDVKPANEAAIADRNELLHEYDGWVIIDTPPSGTSTMNTAINVADVVIIPTQPTSGDLIPAARTYRATRNGIVLLTRAKPRTLLYRDAIAWLDEAHVTRFETCISEREAIKRMHGTTEYDRAEYDSVVNELIKYVRAMREGE